MSWQGSRSGALTEQELIQTAISQGIILFLFRFYVLFCYRRKIFRSKIPSNCDFTWKDNIWGHLVHLIVHVVSCKLIFPAGFDLQNLLVLLSSLLMGLEKGMSSKVATLLFLLHLTPKSGELGDCWFLGALAVVATRIDLIKQLIITIRPEYGFYQFRFYKVPPSQASSFKSHLLGWGMEDCHCR